MSWLAMPLSTEALCWKNSIQGVTVAPMLDTIISRKAARPVRGRGPQVTTARVTSPSDGLAQTATATKIRLKTARPAAIRSHRR